MHALDTYIQKHLQYYETNQDISFLFVLQVQITPQRSIKETSLLRREVA